MGSKLYIGFFVFIFFNTNVFSQTSDLSITIIADKDVPYIRSNVKFTVTITNAGPHEATGVSVLSVLGDGYGALSDISSNGITAGNTITWSDLKIDVKSNVFLHFSAKVLSKGNYLARSEIITSDNFDPNSDPYSSFDENDLGDRYLDDDEAEIASIVPLPSNFDNDRLFDRDDIDDDNDGIPDVYEVHGVNPDADFDEDGVPVFLDDNDNNFDIGDNNGLAESFFDFDSDNIPNHLDYDSDGDGIYDIYETGFKDFEANQDGRINGSYLSFGANGLFNQFETAADSGELVIPLLNTDNDSDLNFLDIDDDNDGVLTIHENADPNGDGNPEDAKDSDSDGVPDYLDSDTSLAAGDNQQEASVIDEASEQPLADRTATIRLKNANVGIKLFTDKGHEITPKIQRVGNLVQLDISNLASGIYFIQFKTGNKIDIKRMVID